MVLASGETLDASLRGRLKQEVLTGDKVVIGDRVEVEVDDDGSGTIERVLERTSQVVRRGTGGRRPKVVAANVDRLLVVASAGRPEPRQPLFDRLLVVGEANGLETVVIMNKADLLEARHPGGEGGRGEHSPARALVELYRGIGYQVLETSARTGQGLDVVRALLGRGIAALVGPSGVGKSSLLNALEPELGLRTGELSHRNDKGRHTTVSARLLALECGGLVADTPGFSDVGVWAESPTDLERCFPEFAPYRGGCRFRGCTHLHEPDCKVRVALEQGAIDPLRFESYRILVDEAEGS